MKKVLLIFLVVVFSFSVFAAEETSNFLKDIGFCVGHSENYFSNNNKYGLNGLIGVDIGLTSRLELNIVGIGEITPIPASRFQLGAELNYSLLGDRVSKIRTSGTGLNSMLGLGLYCNKDNPKKLFMPTTVVLRLYPISFLTPAYGKRQRLLPVGVAYNYMNKDVSMFFSLMIYDYYFKGTWKTDYR